MNSPTPLSYATPRTGSSLAGPGYWILMSGNVLVVLASLFMIKCGGGSLADGWGGIGVGLMDLLLIGVQFVLLVATIVYAIRKARRHPVRDGNFLACLIIVSVLASSLAAGAIATFMLMPHKGGC
jgi:asparagine N-glycosylation enzyme membrane subunit Stt3